MKVTLHYFRHQVACEVECESFDAAVDQCVWLLEEDAGWPSHVIFEDGARLDMGSPLDVPLSDLYRAINRARAVYGVDADA